MTDVTSMYVTKHRDKFAVRERVGNRMRQLASFVTREEAEEYVRKSTERVSLGTVAQWLDYWLKGQTTVRKNSIGHYDWCVRQLVTEIGRTPLKRLSRDDCEALVTRLAQRYTRHTIRHIVQVLRAALTDAVREGVIPRSPAQSIGIPEAVTVKKEIVRLWTTDEQKVFRMAIRDHPLEILFLSQMWYTARRGEALALKWSALAKDRLLLGPAIVNSPGGMIESKGKSKASVRWVPVHAEFVELFDRLDAATITANGFRLKDEYIGKSRLGGVFGPKGYDRVLAKAIKGAGLPPLSSHGLRKIACTNLAAKCKSMIDVRTACSISGHSDLATFCKTYIVPDVTNARELMDRPQWWQIEAAEARKDWPVGPNGLKRPPEDWSPWPTD